MSALITAIALAVAIVQRKRRRHLEGNRGLAVAAPNPIREPNAVSKEISHCKRRVIEESQHTGTGIDDDDIFFEASVSSNTRWEDDFGIGEAFLNVLVSADDRDTCTNGLWQLLISKLTPTTRDVFHRILHGRIVDDPRPSQTVFEQTLSVLSILSGASRSHNAHANVNVNMNYNASGVNGTGGTGGSSSSNMISQHERVTIECIALMVGNLCQQIYAANVGSKQQSLFHQVVSAASASRSTDAQYTSSSSSSSAVSSHSHSNVPLLKARALTQLLIASLIAYKQKMSQAGKSSYWNARSDQMRQQEWHEWLAAVRAEACRRTNKVPELSALLLSVPYLDDD